MHRLCLRIERVAPCSPAASFSFVARRSFITSLSFMLLLCSIAAGVRADDQPAQSKLPVVMLESREAKNVQGSDPGLLLRELGRQAVLIAARDGLGLATRDEALREPFPKDQGAPIVANTSATVGKTYEIILSRDGKEILRKEFPFDLKKPRDPKQRPTLSDYRMVAEACEALSRREMPDALKAAGFPDRARKPDASAPLPRAVEPLLAEINLVSQFEAVRQVHAAIRDKGESQALLGALVRGYANLGQLTFPYWNATPLVYDARALLYAQRMIAEDPKSPLPIWHRAYARAMMGYHADALDDLAAADALAAGGNVRPPPWVALIKPLCEYNTRGLLNLAAQSRMRAPLAMYMCFLTVEQSWSDSVVMEMGLAALKVDPRCLRIVDSLAGRAGVSSGHELSVDGPLVLADLLSSHLHQLEGLPALVKAVAPPQPVAYTQPATCAAVEQAFVDAGDSDSAEPSWAALGRMLQEESFLQVYQRAQFMAIKWGVDRSGFLAAADPLIAHHPYADFVRAMKYDPYRQQARIRQAIAGMKVVDGRFTMIDIYLWSGTANDPSSEPGMPNGAILARHSDCMPGDLMEQYKVTPANLSIIDALEQVSPYSPQAAAIRVNTDWNSIAPNAEAWEKKFGNHPDVQAALARKYIALKKDDDAMRNLKKYIETAPDEWAYEAIANIQLRRGDEAAWLDTLKEYLTKPDYGLTHTQVRVVIAKHYMAKGDYKTAQPWAEEAAQSWAQWAMQTAERCDTHLGQWDKAETWVRRECERYGTPLKWYFWCRSTKHGHIDQARRAVDQYVASGAPATQALGLYYVAENSPKTAAEIFKSCFQSRGNVWSGICAAMAMDASGDSAGRDQMLKAVSEAKVPNDPAHVSDSGIVELAGKLQTLLAEHFGPSTPEQKAKDLAEHASDYHAEEYFIGEFLAQHGHPAAAKEAFTRAIKRHDTALWAYDTLLATQELEKLGGAAPAPETAPVSK